MIFSILTYKFLITINHQGQWVATMARFVFLSGRLHSAAALLRVVGYHGSINVRAVYVDHGFDVRDYLNFVTAVTKYADVPLDILTSQGLHDYFRNTGHFRLGGASSCHIGIKMIPITKYCFENVNKDNDILYFGRGNLNLRGNGFINQWLEGYTIRYPMDFEPKLNHDQLIDFFTSLDIPVPQIFASKLIGSTCRGGCIYYTVRDWVSLYRYDRSLFDEWEKLEIEMLRVNPKNTLCTAKVNGSIVGITLSQIRLNADRFIDHPVHRYMGSCLTDRKYTQKYVDTKLNELAALSKVTKENLLT